MRNISAIIISAHYPRTMKFLLSDVYLSELKKQDKPSAITGSVNLNLDLYSAKKKPFCSSSP